MNIVFFGSSKYVIPIIEVLQQNFNLFLVVTTEQEPTDAVPSYCKKKSIPRLSVSNLSDPKTISQLSPASRDNFQLGILAYLGLILPKSILELFPHGILNIHPSLLPKYRGPTPGQTAILNGDDKTGVTIIKLDKEVDHGPILSQIEEKILPTDTAETLYDRLFKIESSSIVQTIELYIKGKIAPKKQDHTKATFTSRLKRQDGYIDILNPPSPEKLDRMIKAYFPWPGVWSEIELRGSTKLSLVDARKKLKMVKLLPEKKIQVEGKKPMTYKDFVNGYPGIPPVILSLIQDISSLNERQK